MTRIGVIGSAIVGQTLAGGLKKHGYDVRIASRTPDKHADFPSKSGIPAAVVSDVAAWAEALVLAVKGTAAESALREAGESNINGKVARHHQSDCERAARGRRAALLHIAERIAHGTPAAGFPEREIREGVQQCDWVIW